MTQTVVMPAAALLPTQDMPSRQLPTYYPCHLLRPPSIPLVCPPPWSPLSSCWSSPLFKPVSTLLSSLSHALVTSWVYKGHTFHLELCQILLILTPSDSKAAIWSQTIGRMAQQCVGSHFLRAKIHTQFTWLFAFVYKLYINMYPPKTVSY